MIYKSEIKLDSFILMEISACEHTDSFIQPIHPGANEIPLPCDAWRCAVVISALTLREWLIKVEKSTEQ